MAISDASQTFTDAQLLAHAREAYARLLVGPGVSYTINGRTYTKNDLDKLQKAIEWLEKRIEDAAAGEAGGGNVLVRYGERV